MKLADEKRKPQPNQGTLAYGEKVIRGRFKEINLLRRKLGLPEREV